MRVRKVEATEADMLSRILQIHDEMPRVWDPAHYVTPEHFAKMESDILATADSHGFWVLAENNSSEIEGMIWAKIKRSVADQLVCAINSFWISPELRNRQLAPLLTEACLKWARTRGAVTLECSTHTTNDRMRTILEKHGFKPGMISYSLGL